MSDKKDQSNTAQSDTEIISKVAHELRAPITASRLFIEMLVSERIGKLSEKQKEYMNDVQGSNQRMAGLVNELLNVSRIETGRIRIDPKEIDLVSFIDDIISEIKSSLDSNKCRIDFKSPFDAAQGKKEKLPKILLDPGVMQQVLHNLIINAIRYSPDKCSVSVRLEKEKSYYLLTVHDSGMGIPAEEQPKIFTRFFRSTNVKKAVPSGLGLGLYVSRMLLDIAGGKIWFESVLGKGTTFYVSLPLTGMKKREGEKGLAI